jgi:hypothetical protein
MMSNLINDVRITGRREGAAIMPRLLLLVLLFLLAACLLAPAQLSPRAGAVSDGLYTNLYFGLNYKLPADWLVSFVAMEGECPRECMLLDARAPGERSRRAITITAEFLGTSVRGDHEALAGTSLEQAGAKKLAPVKEIVAAGRNFYRADYRSSVLGGELYHAVLMLPAQQYAVVFSFSAESRKQLDAMVDELPKVLRFVGGS